MAIKSQIRNARPSVPLKVIKNGDDDDDSTLLPALAHATHTHG
jgi:hypothetical protein